MFLRESEGVYQFGSKRVAVRVDKDKINSKIKPLKLSVYIPFYFSFQWIFLTYFF